MADNEKKRTCFVITPIGNPDDPIRRHIDGVIESAVVPAFEGKYDVRVAHKMMKTGSITKQVIEEIYKDDLVIVNLTDKNPNVMYELAFRHSVGKPAIVIALEGTSLPFDIKDDRTLFYKNDMAGSLELRKQLVEIERNIDFDENKKSGMIYDYLRQIGIEASIIDSTPHTEENGENPWSYVVQRLDRIESRIAGYEQSSNNSRIDLTDNFYIVTIQFFAKINDMEKTRFEERLEKTFSKYGLSEPVTLVYGDDPHRAMMRVIFEDEVEEKIVRQVVLSTAAHLSLKITNVDIV